MNLLSAGSGGAVNYARNLAPVLAEKIRSSGGGKLTILAYPGLVPAGNTFDPTSFQVMEYPHLNGLRRVVWEQFHIKRIVAKTQPDVLFTPYQIAPAVHGVRTVLMLRNMEPFRFRDYKSPPLKNLRNLLLRELSRAAIIQATHVIAVAQHVEEFLIRDIRVPANNVSMIYHGRDKRFSSDFRTHDAELLRAAQLPPSNFILTCGSLLPYRRCEDIVRAFVERTSKEFPTLSLVVAGAPLDVDYAALTCSFPQNLKHRICFLGHVNADLLAALYRRSATFVSASEVEACPNIAIEAMASGCRIVSANTVPLMELFGDSALYYQSRNWQELANRITESLSADGAAANRVSLALRRSERFSWETCAQQTFDLLHRVANTLPANHKNK